jgi:ATP-dependent RNA helicase DOB1
MHVFLPKDLRPLEAHKTVWKGVLKILKRFPDGIPPLDPIANMNIKDDKFKALVDVREHF